MLIKGAIPAQNIEGYIELSVVLVEGDIGDYAAYCGQGSDEFVAAHGDKISYDEANIHFAVD